MKAIKLKSLRCFAALTASILLFTAGLVSCSDSDSSDDKSDPSQIVENPPVITPSETEEQKSLYGTYWGSLTVAGQSYDMALVANGTTASLYSTMMTQRYPVVKYVKNADGTYTLHCYNSGEDTTADSTHVKVTFTLGENGAVTCVPLIVPMAAMAQFSTCTKGNAYNGEYDGQGGGQGGQGGSETTYPDVAQSTLYGSYWGKLNFGSLFDMCLVVSSEKITLASSVMTYHYDDFTFEKSETNKWTATCWQNEGHTAVSVSVVFDTSATPYQAVATIVPMSASSEVLTMGKEYNDEFSPKEREFSSSVNATFSQAVEQIPVITENTSFKLNGQLESDSLTNIYQALYQLYVRCAQNGLELYVELDFTDVTGFTEIPDNAFNFAVCLASIKIPSTVTKIGNSAFDSSGLSSIDIPDSVTQIGELAFHVCSRLKIVTIGKGLTTIPKNCFAASPELESVQIGENVQTIGENAFQECGLKEVIIPDSVKIIEACAFINNNNKLKKVHIGKNVDTIGERAFNKNKTLTDFTVDSSNPIFSSDGITLYNKDKSILIAAPGISGNYTISSTVSSIKPLAFESTVCNSITVPDKVTSLGKQAFWNSEVEKVTLGTGITSLTNCCFLQAKKLTEVNIPDTVTLIEAAAFQACTSLKSVFIPSSVTEIQAQAFLGCSALETINIPVSVTSIGQAAFRNCTSLKSIAIPNGVEQIAKQMFDSCKALESVSLGSGLKTIDGNVFANTASLKSITIPSQVTKIGKNAFNKSAIESVTFEDTTGSWYATDNTDYTGGEKIEGFPSSTDKAANATALNTTYKGKYLYKVNE